MSTQFIAQNLLSGVLIGALYGIAAMGLSLSFGVLKVLNVAHGELIMLGGYGSWILYNDYGVDPFLSLIVVLPAMFVVGSALHLGLFAQIVRSHEEDRIRKSLLIGFGLTLIGQTWATKQFTGDDQRIPLSYSSDAIEIFGLRAPYIRLSGLVIGIIIVILLQLFMHRTYIGKAIRATAEDWESASLTGINFRTMYLFTFSLGASLAALAGTLISVQFSISPSIGLHWTLKALIVVVFAGLGSIPGTFLAGMLLGLAETSSALIFGSQYRQVAGLVLFVLILSVRSQGLFGSSHA